MLNQYPLDLQAARRAGVSNDKIDDAGEADDEKGALIDLILAVFRGGASPGPTEGLASLCVPANLHVKREAQHRHSHERPADR